MSKYHFIYKTTNLVNGKEYHGKHSTDDLNDGYLGSGYQIKAAIKKYGKTNFERTILEFCENEDDLSNLEKTYIGIDMILSKESYNMALGGQGGCIVLKEGHPKYKSTIQKITDARRTTEARFLSAEIAKENHKSKRIGMYGKKQSDHQKDIASRLMTGRVVSSKTKDKHRESLRKTFEADDYVHPNKGRVVSEKHKEKLKPSWTKLHATYECKYCKRKIKGLSNHNRWHNDNCKLKDA